MREPKPRHLHNSLASSFSTSSKNRAFPLSGSELNIFGWKKVFPAHHSKMSFSSWKNCFLWKPILGEGNMIFVSQRTRWWYSSGSVSLGTQHIWSYYVGVRDDSESSGYSLLPLDWMKIPAFPQNHLSLSAKFRSESLSSLGYLELKLTLCLFPHSFYLKSYATLLLTDNSFPINSLESILHVINAGSTTSFPIINYQEDDSLSCS